MQLKKIFYFLSSAGLTGLIYIGILFLTGNIWHLNLYACVSIAYLSAMAFYFVTNKLIVFKTVSKEKHLNRQIGQFLIMICFNYGITLLLVWSIKKITGEIYTGSVVAGLVTTLLAYLVFERIFREDRRKKTEVRRHK